MSIFRILILLTSLLLSSGVLPLQASQDTDRSSRLSLIRQATGQASTGSPGSFSSHVDSILNQTQFETERIYAEQSTTPQFTAGTQTNTDLITGLTTEAPKEKERTKVDAKSEESKPLDQRIQADQATVEKEQAKRLEDQRLKEAALEKETLEGEAQQEKPGVRASEGKLRPSLAQNPFYFSEESRQSFEDNKSIIVGRLMQAGYARTEADNLVSAATSSEELVLSLMQNEGMEYGQAADYANV